MNRTVIIFFLFTVLLSGSAYSQHSKARLDKKMEKQLQKNMTEKLDYYGLLDGYLSPEEAEFTIGLAGGIDLKDWVWGGDTAALYVNVFKCKDDKISRYVEKKVIKRYRNRTVYEQENMRAVFRVDTINDETVLCFQYVENLENSDFYESFEYRLETDFKGVWYVDDKPVLLYGNVLDKYFDIEEYGPMKAPFPPHKTIFRYADKRYTKPFPKSIKYGVISNEYYMGYRKGRLSSYPNTVLRLWRKENMSIETDEEYLDYMKNAIKMRNK